MLLPVGSPGGEGETRGRGPARGGAKCVRVHVSVPVSVRRSEKASGAPAEVPWKPTLGSWSLHLASIIVGGGEGRGQNHVCVGGGGITTSAFIPESFRNPFARARRPLLPVEGETP